MTQIIGSGEWWKNDQYILATQVKQVFYLEDPAKPNVKVVEHVNHKKFFNRGVIVIFAYLMVINEVDRTANIIDVLGEDDDISDDEDLLPHDLADSDVEDLIPMMMMMADVARAHGGIGGVRILHSPSYTFRLARLLHKPRSRDVDFMMSLMRSRQPRFADAFARMIMVEAVRSGGSPARNSKGGRGW
ncbi:hypothetical protein Tco_0702579 [Tanacetum coccineum]|uniref:Uncharacterized protein n=1 Tax=Tanacetum coccineum TaxID=301880 RepID=A0ABQ4XY96_9ASTR